MSCRVEWERVTNSWDTKKFTINQCWKNCVERKVENKSSHFHSSRFIWCCFYCLSLLRMARINKNGVKMRIRDVINDPSEHTRRFFCVCEYSCHFKCFKLHAVRMGPITTVKLLHIERTRKCFIYFCCWSECVRVKANGGLSNAKCESSHFAASYFSSLVALTHWNGVICHIRNLI